MAKNSRRGRPAAVASRRAPLKKQAVVVIHGMGEQRPMETLRKFVHAVWSTDLSLTVNVPGKRTVDPQTGKPINRSWIVPDERTASHELRRITTPADIRRRRTDFYELYWADITQGHTLQRIISWIQGLLLRKPGDIPTDARRLYIAAWLMVAVAVAPTVALWLANGLGTDVLLPAAAWSVLAAAILGILYWFVVPYFGDVAAYARAEASTVADRTLMRERGLALMEPLMEDDEYDRIVLVSHSLGTIIAYDLLQILWVKYGPSHRNPRQEPEVLAALERVGRYSGASTAGMSLTAGEKLAFRNLQWELYSLLRNAPAEARPWKISDFITFGSPLSHAEFLVTRTSGDFRRGVEERLFATCPPISEKKKEPHTILYKDRQGKRHAHHAAVFAATRWTNVFDLGNLWSTGDPFSGAMTENFGPGIEEIRVRLRWKLFGFLTRLFTHTTYWSMDAEGREVLPSGKLGERSHIDVLRDAVDLGRAMEAPATARVKAASVEASS